MVRITSIASQKGGVAKTTTAITLSAGLARRGKKVLLIDIDSQANASKVLLPHYIKLRKEDTLFRTIIEKKPLPIHQTFIPNLDIVPSYILLSTTDVELAHAMDRREARLKRELDKIKNNYEYVLIDCPPALGWLTINAFTASNKILILVSPGYFELESLKQIGKTIQEVKEYYNPELDIQGYLFAMSDPTVNSRDSLDTLREIYGDKVLRAVIPRNTDIRDAHFNKKDIFSFNPKASSALAYKKLIEEVFV